MSCPSSSDNPYTYSVLTTSSGDYVVTINAPINSTTKTVNEYNVITDNCDGYKITTTNNTVEVLREGVGQQGPIGDSISNVYISSGHLHVVVTDHTGNNTTDYDLGDITGGLSDATFSISNLTEGDILQYDGTNFINHSLTTARISDIDNTNKTDGALLVYSGTTSKYTATTTLNNANTYIIGGTF